MYSGGVKHMYSETAPPDMIRGHVNTVGVTGGCDPRITLYVVHTVLVQCAQYKIIQL